MFKSPVERVAFPTVPSGSEIAANVSSEAYRRAFAEAFRDRRTTAALESLEKAGLKTLQHDDALVVFVKLDAKVFRSMVETTTPQDTASALVRYRLVQKDGPELYFELPASVPVKFLKEDRLKA